VQESVAGRIKCGSRGDRCWNEDVFQMRQLKETVVSISAKHYDVHRSATDGNSLNDEIEFLEELPNPDRMVALTFFSS